MKTIFLQAAMLVVLFMSSVAHAQPILYGLTTANSIFSINNTTAPSRIDGPYTISGVAKGQYLVGLDARPGNGWLYTLGYDSLTGISQLYHISYTDNAYAAIPVGSATTAINLGLTNHAAMDFVATAADQIRIIARNGNNYIVDADDGRILATGKRGLSFVPGDVHTGGIIMGATAYTNNFYGADATQEVGFDVKNNVLVRMDPANFTNGFNNAINNTRTISSSPAVVFSPGTDIGMDTWYDAAAGSNIIFISGKAVSGAGAHLYSYDLSAGGTMNDLGIIGNGSFGVRAIAFGIYRDTTTVFTGHMVTALSLNMRNLVYFDSDNPRVIRNVVRLSGITAGQAMIAIDYSSNGMLYGLGYNSIDQNGQLYIIDTISGAVSAVSPTPILLNLGTDDGSGNQIRAGFRFISTATDIIRLTGNNGAVNMQLDATTGTAVATNTPLQYITGDANYGAAANLTSIAFTGYSGDSVTQMFGFDANTGSMVMFSNANSNAGYGDGTSGYINTNVSLNSTLSLLAHTSRYNNSYMTISYDQVRQANYGYMAANYYGDSDIVSNYSVLYDMSSMLFAYNRGAMGVPVMTGRIGAGIPVKDIAIRRWALTPSNLAPYVLGNTLLVYPNPVRSHTRIVMNERSTGMIHASILNTSGKVERTYKYAPGSYVLDMDMSDLAIGMYSVQVSGPGIATTRLRVDKQ